MGIEFPPGTGWEWTVRAATLVAIVTAIMESEDDENVEDEDDEGQVDWIAVADLRSASSFFSQGTDAAADAAAAAADVAAADDAAADDDDECIEKVCDIVLSSI
eukprot:jgi/Psemu1/32210/gm1.32210_g